MKNKDLILVGGGGHCKSCIEVIETSSDFIIKGILDLPGNTGNMVLGYPVIGTDSDIAGLVLQKHSFLVTLGSTGPSPKRAELYRLLRSLGAGLVTVAATTAVISRSARLGAGTIVMHHAIVNASAVIGDNCIINSRALVEHDAVIGDHCHISTGAIINGGVRVGEGTFFGSGAIAVQEAVVPAHSFIKAHTLFIK